MTSSLGQTYAWKICFLINCNRIVFSFRDYDEFIIFADCRQTEKSLCLASNREGSLMVLVLRASCSDFALHELAKLDILSEVLNCSVCFFKLELV